jgi:hypothetical protein
MENGQGSTVIPNISISYDDLLIKFLIRRIDAILPFKPKDPKYSDVVKIIKEDIIAYFNNHSDNNIQTAEYLLITDLMNKGNDGINEVDAYLNMWYSKWKQRTKIVSRKDFNSMHTLLSPYIQNAMVIHIEPILMKSLLGVAVETLIEEKELACTTILAKDIVMFTLRESNNVIPNMRVEDELGLMNAVIRKTKGLSKLTGPLVYLMVG